MKQAQIKVYIQPGAKKSEIVGMHADAIKVRIQSPPVDGKANEALILFLSTILGVSKSAVQIMKGNKSRIKTVVVAFSCEAERTIIENKIKQLLSKI